MLRGKVLGIQAAADQVIVESGWWRELGGLLKRPRFRRRKRPPVKINLGGFLLWRRYAVARNVFLFLFSFHVHIEEYVFVGQVQRSAPHGEGRRALMCTMGGGMVWYGMIYEGR